MILKLELASFLFLPNQSFLCLTLHGQLYSFFGPPTRKSVTFPPLTTISSLPLPRKSRAEQGADEAASVCKASTFSWRLTLDGNRWPAAFSIGQTSFLRDKLRAGEVCQPVVILRLLFFIALPPLRKDQAFYRCWSFTCIACITCIRYAVKQKKRYYLGIFPKRRTPTPTPPFWEPLIIMALLGPKMAEHGKLADVPKRSKRAQNDPRWSI